jgi:hypothetical protein
MRARFTARTTINPRRSTIPGPGKFAAYAAMLITMAVTTIGGFGWLLPNIYGLDTDAMFVLLPTALLMILTTIYFEVVILARMIRRDINPMENR